MRKNSTLHTLSKQQTFVWTITMFIEMGMQGDYELKSLHMPVEKKPIPWRKIPHLQAKRR